MKTLKIVKLPPRAGISVAKSFSEKCLYVRTTNTIYRIKKASIVYLEAQGNYTQIHTETEKYCSSKTLKHYVELLNEHRFIRPHQSYLVNKDHIIQFHYDSRNMLVLRDGAQIPVSRSRKVQIVASFQNF